MGPVRAAYPAQVLRRRPEQSSQHPPSGVPPWLIKVQKTNHYQRPQRKIKKAREDGNLPRSQDFGHFAAIAAGGSALVVLAPQLSGWLKQLLAEGLRFDAQAVLRPELMGERLAEMALKLLAVVLPLGVLMATVAVAASIAIGGWNFSIKALQPKFAKFNPITGLPRIFAKQQLITALKACALALVLGTVGALYLQAQVDVFASTLGMDLPAAIGQVASTMLSGLLLLLLVIALFAAVDAPLQKWLHLSRLKMSHNEVKQEFKQAEGNQEVKGRIRQRMREASRRRMMAAVPERRPGGDEPDPLCGRAEVRRGPHGRTARRRQGRRPDRAGDPRPGQDIQGAGAAGAGAGARAVCPRRTRPRDPGRAVRRRGPGAGLCLPAARALAGRGAMPGRAAARSTSRAELDPHHADRRRGTDPMNRLIQLRALLGANGGAAKALMAPLFIIMVLAMMVLPLPPFALDLLFTFNIAMALMVMVVAAYMVRPLDFAVFPAVILLTTLLRLSLNVASTRVVLLEGHTGPGAAGAVIESFGHFLIGGNFAVGLIVFAILVVINFIVITKGAERIAEVGARFTLDAMPGKQMAIDADLNAGLIDDKEAKRRRAEVGEEAEFFGSMDGASKYVRGDAMAGLLILLINIVGGFIIGVAQHDLSAGQAASSYVLLAVGDALVAQIPVAADLGRGGDGGVAGRQGAGRRRADHASSCSIRRARWRSPPA